MSDVTCQRCSAKCELYLCVTCQLEMRQLLSDMPWWLARLQQTALGQAKLGEPGGRRQHRSGLERYTDPKPAADGKGGTEGQRRLEHDLDDDKFRGRLLGQGGVNARASDLYDEVQNMLGSWVRDVCERRGVDVPHIGTAAAMALWLRERVSSLASAECADESYSDIKDAAKNIERTVNRPPEPKTCGPCPTFGEHTKDGFVVGESRTRCGTRLEARMNAKDVRCPTCKQTHDVEALITRLMTETQYTHYTIPELCQVVLPRLNEQVPQSTLQRWYASGALKPVGSTVSSRGKTIPQFVLADVRQLRHQMRVKKAVS